MTPRPRQHGSARSQAMQEAMRALRAAIAQPGGVLISGEPGSGHELFARAVHLGARQESDAPVERLLRRAMRPEFSDRGFVVVDCTEIATLEQRLFGEVSAADRGRDAVAERISKGSAFDQAHGGTLVFRHVSELPSVIQARLARILRTGHVCVNGVDATSDLRRVEMRFIATLEIGSARVGTDLHPYLSQAVIEVPSLRRRREDIPALAQLLVTDLCDTRNRARKVVSAQAADLLAALPWRGNTHELAGFLRPLVEEVPGRLIRLADVLSYVRLDGSHDAFVHGGTLKEARRRFEREYVTRVLDQHRGRMSEAAKALGIQRTNLYRKVRQLSVSRQLTVPMKSARNVDA
jgi:DNA-binding NtrC family response regulator